MTSEDISTLSSGRRIVSVNIEEEMKSSYLDYAMSVIIGRAIPDVRDGLKPVHRRTLFAMGEMGNTHDKPYKKSARIVGEVMGKYHPHGDASIYDTLVKMAQTFSYRCTLVEGQGNFGSIDGDSAAAMRYTEARLDPVSEAILEDIDKDTVNFTPNFDESLKEPVVLPSKIPNLLVNGSDGIAVGMATKMPPHNIGEVCRGVCSVIDNPEISVSEIMEHIPGPDFPTGGVILGRSGIVSAYSTGRGRIKVRGVAEVEDMGKKSRIIITEIPYQVNKARLIEHIAELVKDKRIDGISDLRDESDKDGIRVVVELKSGIVPLVVLNQLFKHTPLESTFGIINLSIVDSKPRVLGIKELIGEFIKHRKEVVFRRTRFELKKAEDRLHLLKGLLLALDNIDAVIAAIRASKDSEEAKAALVENFGLDLVQADAILKMQLRRLAALEHQKILVERDGLLNEVERLNLIISDEDHILAKIRQETVEMGEKFSDERRTMITHDVDDFDKEDLIENRAVLVSLTGENYIKSMPLDTYKGQKRGGKGIIGMACKDEDAVKTVFVANSHDYLLCFTSAGRVYWLKVYDIPEASRQSRGKAIVNLLNLGEEKVSALIPVSEFKSDEFFLFSTKHGMVVKIPQNEFSRPRTTGMNAITMRDDDELVGVLKMGDDGELVLTSVQGQTLRMGANTIPLRHRNALGVKGMKLRFMDELKDISAVEMDHLLTVTEKGYGKRTDFGEFRGHGRATMGVRNIQTDVAGGVVASRAVSDDDEIILMSSSGIVIRTKVSEISIQKRGTRGVRVMKVDSGDSVVGFTVLGSDGDEEENDGLDDSVNSGDSGSSHSEDNHDAPVKENHSSGQSELF